MSFEEILDGRRSGRLGYWNGIDFSSSESPCLSNASHQVSAKFDTEMSCEDVGYLGHRKRTVLAILNFHVAPMPPTKFQLSSTFDSGDVEYVKS